MWGGVRGYAQKGCVGSDRVSALLSCLSPKPNHKHACFYHHPPTPPSPLFKCNEVNTSSVMLTQICVVKCQGTCVVMRMYVLQHDVTSSTV